MPLSRTLPLLDQRRSTAWRPRKSLPRRFFRTGSLLAIALLFVAGFGDSTLAFQEGNGAVAPPAQAEPAPVEVPDPLPALRGMPVPRPGVPPLNGPEIAEPPRNSEFRQEEQGIIADRSALRIWEMAQQKLEQDEFDDALQLLQSLANREFDSLVPIEEQGRFESLQNLVDRAFSQLSPEARDAYELQFGIGAQKQLQDGLRDGDTEAIEEVARRFFRTRAGLEATFHLARISMDRGDFLTAALLLDRLRSTGSTQFEPQLSMRLLLAAERARLDQLAARTRDRLEAQGKNPPNLPGDQIAGHARFTQWLKQASRVGRPEHSLWKTATGDVNGLMEPQSVTIAGGVKWQYRITDSAFASAEDRTLEQGIAQAARNAQRREEITIPVTSPLMIGDLAIFRTLKDIRAIDAESGELKWRTVHPHSELFDVVLKQFPMLFDEELSFGQNIAPQEFLSQYAWRNMTVGTLSTDGEYVYAIDQAGMVSSGMAIVGAPRDNRVRGLGRDSFNTLTAFDVTAEGRIAWSLGGPPENPSNTGLFFLGPPLPLAGRLFILAEEEGEIHLLALDPQAPAEQRIAWRQPLVAVTQTILSDPVRRLSGLTPTFSDGVLVCPTGTGSVVAVDLRDRSFRWGYQYDVNVNTIPRVNAGQIFMGGMTGTDQFDRSGRWIDAIPRIADDFILLTPRNSDELHCLDRESGQLKWKRPRGTSLYIAGTFRNQVVIVGRHQIVACDLATGDTLWQSPLTAETRPVGRGVISDSILYLPVVEGKICTFNLANGALIASSSTGQDQTLGNLIALGGKLISASPVGMTGFLDADILKADGANHPVDRWLAIRGEDRLMRGELELGIRDLQDANAQSANPRARDLLVDTLLLGLRRDFPNYRDYIPTLEALLSEPMEHVQFHRAHALGLASEGEHLAAAARLLELCWHPDRLNEITEKSDHWRVRLDRVVFGEFQTIYDAATPSDREEIDNQVAELTKRFSERPELASLETLTTIVGGTNTANSVKQVLIARYDATGDLLRARLLERERDGRSPAAEAPPWPTFPAALRARYRPDEIGLRPSDARIETLLPIPVVGEIPGAFRGWTFHTNDARSHLVALDALGKEQWRIPAISASQLLGVPASLERFQARFQGPLLALGVDSSLLVFDASQPEKAPRLLWSTEIDRADGSGISFRIPEPDAMHAVASLAARFGFAGPRTILAKGARTVTAFDAVSGEQLWSVASSSLDMDLLGDIQNVVLAVSPRQATILRTADGAAIDKRDLGVTAIRLTTSGTNMVRWQRAESGYTLMSYDFASDKEDWRFDFPATAIPTRVGADRIAVLDPATGQLQVIRWLDGQVVLSTAIEANPRVTRFTIREWENQLLVFASDMQDGRRSQSYLGHVWEPFRGTMSLLDASGRVVWSESLKQCVIYHAIPRAIPLVITAEITGQQDQSIWSLNLRDVRGGQSLLSKTREINFSRVEIEASPDEQRIDIRIPMARIHIEPVPPADTPDAPAS